MSNGVGSMCECEPQGLQMINVFQLVKHSIENLYLKMKMQVV